MPENTELATVSINTITTAPAGSMITSIQSDPGDREAAKKVYNAMNNPEYRIANFINKKIAVTDYLIEMSVIENEETGESSKVPRVVLIDEEGKSYQAVSVGMANALRNLVIACGPAPWDPPVTIEIKQQATKNGSMLTASMV